MNQLKELLDKKVSEINGNARKRKLVSEWIDGYRGKVICFQSGEKAFHLVFDGDTTNLREGCYSSCEFTYIGDNDVLLKILDGLDSAMQAGMEGRIKGWGSVNEALAFENVLRS